LRLMRLNTSWKWFAARFLTAELCTGGLPFWSSLRRGLWACIAAVSDALLVLILLPF
jgi:hypothetical protein